MAGGQIYFLKKTMLATTQAAKAAERSAQGVTLALNAERPFLFLDKATLDDEPEWAMGSLVARESRPTGKTIVRLKFDMVNSGKGVAVFDRVHARLILVIDPIGKRPFKFIKLANLFDLGALYTRTIAANGGKATYESFPVALSEQQWTQLKDLRLGLVVRGIVLYRDVFDIPDRKFWTKFAFEYRAPSDPKPQFGRLTVPKGFLIPSMRARDHRYK